MCQALLKNTNGTAFYPCVIEDLVWGRRAGVPEP